MHNINVLNMCTNCICKQKPRKMTTINTVCLSVIHRVHSCNKSYIMNCSLTARKQQLRNKLHPLNTVRELITIQIYSCNYKRIIKNIFNKNERCRDIKTQKACKQGWEANIKPNHFHITQHKYLHRYKAKYKGLYLCRVIWK